MVSAFQFFINPLAETITHFTGSTHDYTTFLISFMGESNQDEFLTVLSMVRTKLAIT